MKCLGPRRHHVNLWSPSTSTSSSTTSVDPNTTTSAAPPTTAATPPPSTAATTVTPAWTLPAGGCATGQLSVSIGEASGAAGTNFSPIIFTNVSNRPCTITGMPGVSLVDAGRHLLGRPAGNVATLIDQDGITPATLAPGASARARFGIRNAGFAPGRAGTPSTSMRVFPPGNTEEVFVAFSASVCPSWPGGRQMRVGPVIGH